MPGGYGASRWFKLAAGLTGSGRNWLDQAGGVTVQVLGIACFCSTTFLLTDHHEFVKRPPSRNDVKRWLLRES